MNVFLERDQQVYCHLHHSYHKVSSQKHVSTNHWIPSPLEDNCHKYGRSHLINDPTNLNPLTNRQLLYNTPSLVPQGTSILITVFMNEPHLEKKKKKKCIYNLQLHCFETTWCNHVDNSVENCLQLYEFIFCLIHRCSVEYLGTRNQHHRQIQGNSDFNAWRWNYEWWETVSAEYLCSRCKPHTSSYGWRCGTI